MATSEQLPNVENRTEALRMTEETKGTRVTVAERLKDVAGVEQALTRAEKQAVAEHARAGRKIPVWRDNRVVWETPQLPPPADGDEPTTDQ